MNMLESRIVENGSLRAVVGEQQITLGQETLAQRPALRAFAGKPVILGIRPEDLEDAELVPEAQSDHILNGRLELREALGSEIMAHFAITAQHAQTDETRELARDVGADDGEAPMGVGADEAVLVGRFGARSRVRKGEAIRAVVDTRALHFFDPETGLGIYDEPPGKGAQA